MNEIAKTLCRADAEQRVRGWIEGNTERWETNIMVSVSIGEGPKSIGTISD
jgi:hypothetical protein